MSDFIQSQIQGLREDDLEQRDQIKQLDARLDRLLIAFGQAPAWLVLITPKEDLTRIYAAHMFHDELVANEWAARDRRVSDNVRYTVVKADWLQSIRR